MSYNNRSQQLPSSMEAASLDKGEGQDQSLVTSPIDLTGISDGICMKN